MATKVKRNKGCPNRGRTGNRGTERTGAEQGTDIEQRDLGDMIYRNIRNTIERIDTRTQHDVRPHPAVAYHHIASQPRGILGTGGEQTRHIDRTKGGG